MSSVIIKGNTSGQIALSAPDVAGTNTLTLPTITGTVGVLVSGTAVASTSGTSIDFNSIPAGVRRITVLMAGVSTNGSSNLQIQLGDSGGVETSGYLSSSFGGANANAMTIVNSTTGCLLTSFNNSTYVVHGSIKFELISTNTWVVSGSLGSSTNVGWSCGGSKALSDTLTQVRITTVNGTDTFDAGSINILYE